MTPRLEALAARHQALEALLAEELKRPAPDSARVAAIKRRKLSIKDTLRAMARSDS